MEISRIGNVADTARYTTNLSTSTGDSVIQAQPKEESKEVEKVSKTELESSVKRMNDVFEMLSTHLKFNFHEGLGEYYVSIVNEDTNQVVREIPPRKFLDMVAFMEKQMKGVFVDESK